PARPGAPARRRRHRLFIPRGPMSEALLQTIRDWNIRRKILTGISVVLLVTVGLGAYAIRAMDRLHRATGSTDSAAEQLYQDSRTLILVLLAVAVIAGV